MNIYFIKDIHYNNNNIINVSSSNNSDICIKNHLDIINASSEIKIIVKYNNNFKKNIIFNLEKLDSKYIDAFIYRILQGFYTFDKYKQNIKSNKNIYFYVPKLSNENKKNLITIIYGSNITRNLINEPSNMSTPDKFSKYSINFFKSIKNIKIKVYNDKEIKKLGLNLINAVGGSSINKPRFLIIDYTPPKYKKSICLIGKGVTIDTGGYSIKSSSHMNNMYMDKEGASISINIIYILSKLKYKNRIICFCPLVENIVSNSSIKPNDIIKAYNCNKYKPDYIFDFATLTGWSERINCHSSFTYFTTNEKISNKIIEYGEKYGEKNIRIPAWLEYMSYIKSKIADVKNHGYECKNSEGLMSSLFLMNFIPQKYRNNWCHFDIRMSNYNNNVNIADGFATYLSLVKYI